jgi:hypothetical protein
MAWMSGGRQVIKLGNGFLINDDGPNLGRARPMASSTAVVASTWVPVTRSIARPCCAWAVTRLHGSVLWLKSDNRAQAETELAAGTLDYTNELGTLGLTYIHGIDVADQWASEFQKAREGMDVYSLRGEGSAGLENTRLAFEYAWQDKRGGHRERPGTPRRATPSPRAPWAPQLTYRYTRYSAGWDLLFTGLSSGYGTWIQGEVAGNYAGPFNSPAGFTISGSRPRRGTTSRSGRCSLTSIRCVRGTRSISMPRSWMCMWSGR